MSTLTEKSTIEDIAWMLETGETVDGVARRAGINIAALSRLLHRHGRHDLARPFDRHITAVRRDQQRG